MSERDKREGPAGRASPKDDESGGRAPEVVDFNALHAALGDLPPAPVSTPSVAESLGRPAATYASAKPHSIPATKMPAGGVADQPAVIVTADDTIPDMPALNVHIPRPREDRASDEPPAPLPGAGLPFTPPPREAQTKPRRAPPEHFRRINNGPRRPRSPTMIVRRGPSKQQKVIVFVMMLVIVVSGGVAFLVIYRPKGLDIVALFGAHKPLPTVAPAPPPAPPPATAVPTATATTAPVASASSLATAPAASSVPAASVSVRKPKPRPAPTATPAPPPQSLP